MKNIKNNPSRYNHNQKIILYDNINSIINEKKKYYTIEKIEQIQSKNNMTDNINSIANEKKKYYTMKEQSSHIDDSKKLDKNYSTKIKEIYSYIDNVYNEKVINTQDK